MNALAVTCDDQGAQYIVSGSQDTHVKVWNVASMDDVLVRTSTVHESAVYAVAVTPDGRRILSGGADAIVGVWFWRLDHDASSFDRLHDGNVEALVALNDNQHALSASEDKTVKLFNIDNGTALHSFTHHKLPVVCLALLPDGLSFVSGAYDKTTCIVKIGLQPRSARRRRAASSTIPQTNCRGAEGGTRSRKTRPFLMRTI